MTHKMSTKVDGANDKRLVEGEYLFTTKDFRQIAGILYGEAGISLVESKATLVYSRLAKRLRLLGLASFRDYCALVDGSDGADERVSMLAALTTSVTRFYREPHHFEDLKSRVLPPLLTAARRGARVRLWSAACSSGQEAYCIAMTILSLAPDAANLDVKILATDIDPNMIAGARGGAYDTSAIEPIPAIARDKWFSRIPEDGDKNKWVANQQLKSIISFRELNLIKNWPMQGKFQAIFCRNVAIYFDDETQAKLWDRLSSSLAPRGTLYMGHSERVCGPAAGRLEPVGVTAYALKTGAAQ